MFELLRKLNSALKISLMDASNCHMDHGFNICVDSTGCYLGVESDVTGETVSLYKLVTSNCPVGPYVFARGQPKG